jgi:hypothetical protein
MYRLSPAQLESAASRLAGQPERAAALLHAIDNKVAAAKNPRPPTPPATKSSTPAPNTAPAKKPAPAI